MPRVAKESDEFFNWKSRSTIVLLLLTVFLASYYFNLRNRVTFSADTIEMDSDTEDHWISPDPVSNVRTQFGGGSTIVRGFPSAGGIYLLQNADPVELEFLSLDRFHETSRSNDAVEEDAFCQRMRAMGARWFDSEEEADEGPPLEYRNGKRVGRTQLWLGWSANGGVWVLEIDEYEGARKGIGGRIRNAKNMEERCKFIEMLGGAFFSDRKHCPLTRNMVF
ncbi:MAG: hypothetical protein LQ352_006270 [Teloschistes flavicans]|nr:MAG: hypothetical protein LQ352_006270 [Teloschistes flavicans]